MEVVKITVRLILLSALWATVFGSDERALGEDPIVRLNPFVVSAGGFSVRYKWDKDERITLVRVTMVVPKSPGAKAGLQVGDQLVRIDGRAVFGMSREKFAAIFAPELNLLHQSITYSFVGARFLSEDARINWTFTYDEAEKSRTK